MSRIITAVVFLILSLTVGITSFLVLRHDCEELSVNMKEVLYYCETGTADEVTASSVRANSLWDSKKLLFHLLLNHEEMTGVETDIKQMLYFAENGDIKTVTLYAESVLRDFDHIKESNEPNLENVF